MKANKTATGALCANIVAETLWAGFEGASLMPHTHVELHETIRPVGNLVDVAPSSLVAPVRFLSLPDNLG